MYQELPYIGVEKVLVNVFSIESIESEIKTEKVEKILFLLSEKGVKNVFFITQ